MSDKRTYYVYKVNGMDMELISDDVYARSPEKAADVAMDVMEESSFMEDRVDLRIIPESAMTDTTRRR